MILYEHIKSSTKPENVEVTSSHVFLAKNIQTYEENLEGTLISGFVYDCEAYTKDEYIKLLDEKNTQLMEELLNTQMALCDIYETIGGDN